MYYNGAGPSSFSQSSHWRAIILGSGDWTPPHDSDSEPTDAPPPAASRGRRRPWRRGVPLHLARGRRSELGCRRSFSLGVASGAPRPDGFVLWTRLAPEPLSPNPQTPGGMRGGDVTLGYEIATDPALR